MDPLSNLNLPSLTPLSGTTSPAATTNGSATDGSSFGDLLQQALKEVNDTQTSSEQEARNLMSGNTTDMHTAILAVQKADVSFQMMMAVRSKLVDAYRAVMQMQM
jgi:flagellar hook-basal body complex protein FliE